MSDFSDLVPLIAARFGLAPSTLVLLIGCIHVAAKVISRRIPNDATGWKRTVGQICAFLGADVSSQITPGVTVQSVLTEAVLAEKAAASADTARADPAPKE